MTREIGLRSSLLSVSAGTAVESIFAGLAAIVVRFATDFSFWVSTYVTPAASMTMSHAPPIKRLRRGRRSLNSSISWERDRGSSSST
jgi:hypothetical protein